MVWDERYAMLVLFDCWLLLATQLQWLGDTKVGYSKKTAFLE
jgi:hypothetical protein